LFIEAQGLEARLVIIIGSVSIDKVEFALYGCPGRV
jgi:hypothetical protein